MRRSKCYDIKQLCVVPPPYGGVTIHVKRLIENLTKDGLAVGAYYSEDNQDPQIRKSLLFDNMQWDSDASYIKKLFNHFSKLVKMCKQVAPYKIVHSHSGLEDMLLIWLVHKVCGKHVVITVHNAMVEELYSEMIPLNRFFLKINANSNIRWIAVSEQVKENLLCLPVTFHNEIDVIPAYIPGTLDLSRPLPKAMNDYIAEHKKIISFYAHSFMLHNGHDVYGFVSAIDLYERVIQEGHDDIGMIFCIQEISETEKVKDLHKYAKLHNVDDKIYWQEGALDNILVLWNQTDVYIRPTYTDGDSVAVREILDMGARVVASDVCWRPDGVYVYKFGDKEDFFNQTMSAFERARANLNFNFEYYHKLKAIYQDCLAN